MRDRKAADALADRSNLRIIAENWIARRKNASEALSVRLSPFLSGRVCGSQACGSATCYLLDTGRSSSLLACSMSVMSSSRELTPSFL